MARDSSASVVSHADVFEVRPLPEAPPAEPEHVIAAGITPAGEVLLRSWDLAGARLVGRPMRVPYERVKVLLAEGLWGHLGRDPRGLAAAEQEELAELRARYDTELA